MTLKQYLFLTDQKAYLFAKLAKVSKDSVYKHINGKPVTYEVANRISKGTGGKVKTAAIYKVGRQTA